MSQATLQHQHHLPPTHPHQGNGYEQHGRPGSAVSNSSSTILYQPSDIQSGQWQPQQQQGSYNQGFWQQQGREMPNGGPPHHASMSSDGDGARNQAYPLPHPSSWPSIDLPQQGQGHFQAQPPMPHSARGSVSAKQTPRNSSRSSLFEQDDADNFKAKASPPLPLLPHPTSPRHMKPNKRRWICMALFSCIAAAETTPLPPPLPPLPNPPLLLRLLSGSDPLCRGSFR